VLGTLQQGNICLAIAASDSNAPHWVHLLPAGRFNGPAGGGKGPWRLTDAAAVIAASLAGGRDLVIDYNHQSEYSARPGVGGTAPAAGWITQLEEREDGIWGQVTWTEAGAAAVAAREYRYLSPVFQFDAAGQVKRILRAGLTNTPALTLTAVAADVDPRTISQPNEDNMDELLKALRQVLNLAEDADGAAVTAAVASLQETSTANQATQDAMAAIAAAAGLGSDTAPEGIATAIATLRQATGNPDPDKFVPMAQHNALNRLVDYTGGRLDHTSIANDLAITSYDKRGGLQNTADNLVREALEKGGLVGVEQSVLDDILRDGVDAYVASIDAAIVASLQLAEQFTAASVDLRQSALDLRFDNDAPLSREARLAAARDDFDAVVSRAAEGGLEAFEELAGAAKDLLGASAAATREAMKAAEALSRTADDLRFDAASPLTPGQRHAAARADFDAIVNRADGGDQLALEDLPGAAQLLVTQSAAFNGFTPAHAATFNEVQAVLARFAGAAASVTTTDQGVVGATAAHESIYNQVQAVLNRFVDEAEEAAAAALAEATAPAERAAANAEAARIAVAAAAANATPPLVVAPQIDYGLPVEFGGPAYHPEDKRYIDPNPGYGAALGGLPPLHRPVWVGEQGPERVIFDAPARVSHAKVLRRILEQRSSLSTAQDASILNDWPEAASAGPLQCLFHSSADAQALADRRHGIRKVARYRYRFTAHGPGQNDLAGLFTGNLLRLSHPDLATPKGETLRISGIRKPRGGGAVTIEAWR
jgi:phage I-like protein